MTPVWQKRRSAFNHDWLKNQFMPALAKFLNLLDDQIEDVAFEQSFVPRVFPEWKLHRQEAFDLLRDFEQEMSPRMLFRQPPLSRCSEQTQRWLGSLVHALWVTRYPVQRWTADALECAEKVDTAYHQLQATLKNCSDIQSATALRPFREPFNKFRKRCQELAKAIEKFPSEVRVT